ncbi:hypothetical protein CVIRNUC_000255 [Coccomyxa viridis]|uniref:Protein kinase domain-containing protein n=1 Tax=Coccomyxa viridis TaxID=1274662 RepID=A0AAV1HPP7_9CHLO|nr:hypothetical protein CVIRNUC_000255 [Coccomyxa viridis]
MFIMYLTYSIRCTAIDFTTANFRGYLWRFLDAGSPQEIACTVDKAEAAAKLTRSFSKAVTHAAADIYSYGRTLWQILTGGSIFCNEKGLPKVPEECPQSILELYLACISSDPRKRPTAMEIMLAVEGALVQIPGAVPAVPPSAADQALPKEHESWV